MKSLTVFYKKYYENKMKSKVNNIKVDDDIKARFDKLTNSQSIIPINNVVTQTPIIDLSNLQTPKPNMNGVWLAHLYK